MNADGPSAVPNSGQESTSFFAFVERLASSAGEAGGEGRGTRVCGSGPAAGHGPYLDQERNPVTEKKEKKIRDVVAERVEVRSCGCRSRFCPRCCLPLGIQLKRKLKAELKRFTGLMMLTFTIDPELFPTPAAAFEYVTKKRCIAVAIQRLFRWRCLHSREYVVVIEWQENGWPHWHVLADASHVPFERLCEAWNRNWPAWEERVALGRPGFGSVRFSASRLENRERAAGYVTAYLTKHPEHGYPDWVLDSPVRTVHRFQTSRGFWKDAGDEEEEQDQEPGEEADAGEGRAPAEEPEERERRTIREQVADCGSRSVVLRARDVANAETGEVETLYEYLGSMSLELPEVLQLASVKPDAVNVRGTVAVFNDVPLALREFRSLLRGGVPEENRYTESQ